MVTKVANDIILDTLDNMAAELGASPLIRLYEGTAPATVDGSLAGATLLAEGPMAAAPFGAATDTNPGGEVVADTVPTFQGIAAGTAEFVVLATSGGTPKYIGDCGLTGSGAECEMTNTNIAIGQDIDVTSCKMVMPESF